MEQPVKKAQEARIEFYRQKGKVHARSTKGYFNTLRWTMFLLTQAIFYGACWLTWDSKGITRQAILFDIPHEKLYFFGTVLWPQDALAFAYIMIVAAIALFFVTAIAGRLFCGFACPQTVYTMLFTWIEEKVEGDHLARMRLDQGPMSSKKLLIKSTKQLLWILVAAWTGITFVGYFTPIRELLAAIPSWDLGPWEGFWVIFYATFMYLQAGYAREAVCQHMCPYSRFQGVMVDANTKTVAYDTNRGEPRSNKRNASGAGDCIDCGICVQVCPTGIDIRNGSQYQCINCGLCIDACNEVMTKIGKPLGLIRFMSENQLSSANNAPKKQNRIRLVAYSGLLIIFSGLAIWTLANRELLLVNVIRDRGPLYRETADGRIENVYTLKLLNLDDQAHRYTIDPQGMPGMALVGASEFTVAAGSIQPATVTISAPSGAAPSGANPIKLVISAKDSARLTAREKTIFILP